MGKKSRLVQNTETPRKFVLDLSGIPSKDFFTKLLVTVSPILIGIIILSKGSYCLDWYRHTLNHPGWSPGFGVYTVMWIVSAVLLAWAWHKLSSAYSEQGKTDSVFMTNMVFFLVVLLQILFLYSLFVQKLSDFPISSFVCNFSCSVPCLDSVERSKNLFCCVVGSWNCFPVDVICSALNV